MSFAGHDICFVNASNEWQAEVEDIVETPCLEERVCDADVCWFVP